MHLELTSKTSTIQLLYVGQFEKSPMPMKTTLLKYYKPDIYQLGNLSRLDSQFAVNSLNSSGHGMELFGAADSARGRFGAETFRRCLLGENEVCEVIK